MNFDADVFDGIIKNLYRQEAMRRAAIIWPPSEEVIGAIVREAVDAVNYQFTGEVRRKLDDERDLTEAGLRQMLRAGAGCPTSRDARPSLLVAGAEGVPDGVRELNTRGEAALPEAFHAVRLPQMRTDLGLVG
jgi:hypothetical protein